MGEKKAVTASFSLSTKRRARAGALGTRILVRLGNRRFLEIPKHAAAFAAAMPGGDASRSRFSYAECVSAGGGSELPYVGLRDVVSLRESETLVGRGRQDA